MTRIFSASAIALFFSFPLFVSCSSTPKPVWGEGLEIKADQVVEDSAAESVTLIGNAQIKQKLRELNGDRIEMQTQSGLIACRGNCVYVANRMMKKGNSMDFVIQNGEWTER